MIIAAEASSAHYAMKLIKEWKAQGKDHYFFGVGTSEMEKMGFHRIGKAEEMAIVGLFEVAKHFSFLKSIFEKLISEATRLKPDLVILMDYPDFNLRLAEKLKENKIENIFYYISPQVWAWRQGRIHQIKKLCKKVFLLFPFEKVFYDQHQVPNEFVGHPLLEDLKEEYYDSEKIKINRQRYGFLAQEKILLLMPGSRRGELERNFPTQLLTAQLMLKKHKNLRIAIAVAPTLEKEDFYRYLENVQFDYRLIKDDSNKVISMSDFVLVTSGTATLIVGLLEKPMVIMYKVNWLTGVIAKRLVKGYIGLVNLVLGQEVAPERVQEQANPQHLSHLLDRFLTDSDYYNLTVSELKKIRKSLVSHQNESMSTTQKVIFELEKYL